MNLGEVAFISKHGVMLPPRLLRALSIFSGAEVFGLSYPRPKSDVDPHYKLTTVDHDLVFTMVPIALWPKLVRIRIRILCGQGDVRPLLRLLADKGLNMVSYECTRGGFRSVTWNILAAFDNLPADNYSTTTFRTRPNLDKAIAGLKRDIHRRCGALLFRDDKFVPVSKTAALLVNKVNALAYFHMLIEEGKRKRVPIQTFSGTIEAERIIVNQVGKDVLADLGYSDRPGYGFASIETHDASLRVALIKAEHQHRFKIIDLSMRRKSSTDSSTGYLSGALDALPKEVAVWRARNRKRLNSEVEESDTRLFLEDRSEDAGTREWDSILRDIERAGAQKGLKVNAKHREFIPFRVFVAHRLKPIMVQMRILDAIRRAGARVGLIGSALCIVEDYVCDSLGDLVVKEMRDCQGLLQVVTESGAWVEAEKFGAKILDIPSVRIVSVQEALNNPEGFAIDRDKPTRRFDLNATDESLEDAFRVAFADLMKVMRHDN